MNKGVNDEEMTQAYERLVENIEQFSMEPQKQIEKLRGTVVPDEIALDFNGIAKVYAKKLFDNKWISKKQYSIVEEIDEKLEVMSDCKSLWSDNALLTAKEWKECRELGKKLLISLTNQGTVL